MLAWLDAISGQIAAKEAGAGSALGERALTERADPGVQCVAQELPTSVFRRPSAERRTPVREPSGIVRLALCCLAVAYLAACGRGPAVETDVIAGVHLSPVPGELRSQCKAAATELGYAVPCPRRLPAGAHPTTFAAGNCP